MLHKLSDFDIETLSLSNWKDATYLQSNNQPFELQTDWITLGQYPLPSKKYVADDAKGITLTAPMKKEDKDFQVLVKIDNSHNKLVGGKVYHNLASEKDRTSGAMGCADGQSFAKFKLYLNSALFDKDKNRISITSLFDFYKYLKEGTTVKIVFGFSKMWTMPKEYGFAMSIKRILLKDEIKEAPERTVSFLDE